MPVRRRPVALASVVLLVAACSREAPPAPPAPAEAAPVVTPAAVTPAQVRALSWLAGRFIGTLDGGHHFYESYTMVDSTTIRMQGYPDSTFRAANDSSLITLRGDTLVSGTAEKSYVAVGIDSNRVTFGPWRGVDNGFIWERGADGNWVATIVSGSGATETRRVYQMRRKP